MNDRLKFRTIVEGNYSTLSGEQKTVQFFIKNVAIIDDEKIGVDYCVLSQAIELLNLSPQEWVRLHTFFDSYRKYSKDLIVLKPLVVEQCLGVTDKNAKLIYEGDIVETYDGEKGTIVWSDEDCCFQLACPDGSIYPSPFDMYRSHEMEIVGNIHENKETVI